MSSSALHVARKVALVLLVAFCATAGAADRELELQTRVFQNALNCIKDGGNRADCFVRASPARCATQAAGMISNRSFWQRNWQVCVRSCADASLWSRTVGDCRR